MREIVMKWKIAIIIIGIVVLSGITIFLVYPRFMEKDFQSEIEIPLNETFNLYDKVCYGNFFSCDKVEIREEGNVDTSKLGEYNIKYVFNYNGNIEERNQVVKVIDNKAPTLDVKGDNFKYCPNGTIPNYEVSAIDDYDGDISSNVKVEADGDRLLFSVSDSSGNETKIFKPARKIDDESPMITLNGDDKIYLPVDGEYTEQGASASDNCDGDITDKIEIESSLNNKEPGEYEINYKIKDSSGLENNVKRMVYVYKKAEINENGSKNVYLTFDDGPSAYTSKLLDVLKKYNVKATFFVTSQNTTKGYDDMIKRAYDEGHTIGIHSYTHSYSYIYTSVDNYFEDLTNMQNKIYNLTGYKSMIVRFPGGSSNTISKNYDGGSHIMSNLAKMLTAKGYRYFDWNVLSGDAGETTDTKKIIKNVTSSLKSTSSVVLQHDTKDFSINAVEEIIKYGLENGYNFLPLTMDSPRVEHSINN